MSGVDRVNIKALYEEIDRAGLDAVIGLAPDNFLYLTGVSMLTRKTLAHDLSFFLGRDYPIGHRAAPSANGIGCNSNRRTALFQITLNLSQQG